MEDIFHAGLPGSQEEFQQALTEFDHKYPGVLQAVKLVFHQAYSENLGNEMFEPVADLLASKGIDVSDNDLKTLSEHHYSALFHAVVGAFVQGYRFGQAVTDVEAGIWFNTPEGAEQ